MKDQSKLSNIPKIPILKPSMKVAVGLSGGVDSSVSALILKESGYEVTGVFIQCWDSKADGCKSDEDRAYAVETAARLGIKFVHVDFRDRYKKEVIDYFYREYELGRTPNPDVLCNKEIKFGLFFDWAMERDFDFVATGHYARIQNDKGEYILLKGSDPSKDQSYFLYLLDERKLSRILFPVGDLYKSQVKSIAEEYGLPAAKRPESMGICFIGEVDIKDFLSKRIKPVEGKLLHVDGSEIGVHAGAAFYTIGQRHGFKSSRYFPDPLYVVSKDIESNTVTVGTFEDAKSAEFCVSSLHWIGNPPKSVSVGCRIRHLGSIYGCRIMPEVGKYRVVLDTPAFGVAPGQSVVFYSGEQVLGGGTIEN